MNDILTFIPALPEIYVLTMTCFILLVGIFTKEKYHHVVYILSQLTLVGAAFLTLNFYTQAPVLTFANMFVLDPVAIVSKLSIYAISFFALLYSRKYIETRNMQYTEYYVLALFSVLGMMVMSSAHHFLTLFLGLEILSLPLYAMVAMRRGLADASEGAMKYFVMGAIASGILLYGMSLIYGATKTLDIAVLMHSVTALQGKVPLIIIFGLVFIIAGLAFKFGAAPFHMWAPDVYQSAPTPVTLYISSAPKVAVLLITFRLLADAMPGLLLQWQQLLVLISVLSMAFGNIVAIVQSNIKRMLAYSAIAHMGYMALGILAGTKAGYAASLFYMITYALMSAGAFAAIIMASSPSSEVELIDDLRGLNQRNPWLAFMMLLLMFSMAGIPPTVGFFAKLAVLEALIGVNMVWLAALALIFAIIGAYYYLKVIKAMYFDSSETSTIISTSLDLKIAVTLNGLLILGLGLFPNTLLQACRTAFAI